MKEILKVIKDEFIQHPWIMTKMIFGTLFVWALSFGVIVYAAMMDV